MRLRFRIPLPTLAPAEKTALVALALILGSGAALRAWEKSGVEIGPVHDLESLRSRVVEARHATGDSMFPCAVEPPHFARGEHWPEREPDTASEASPAEKRADRKEAGKKAPRSILNLNTATAPQLEGLPGVGPATAKAIVVRRQDVNGFRRLEDLLEVRGIGPKKLAALRPWLELTAPGIGAETGKKVLEP